VRIEAVARVVALLTGQERGGQGRSRVLDPLAGRRSRRGGAEAAISSRADPSAPSGPLPPACPTAR